MTASFIFFEPPAIISLALQYRNAQARTPYGQPTSFPSLLIRTAIQYWYSTLQEDPNHKRRRQIYFTFTRERGKLLVHHSKNDAGSMELRLVSKAPSNWLFSAARRPPLAVPSSDVDTTRVTPWTPHTRVPLWKRYVPVHK
jgi:hypothetical protein